MNVNDILQRISCLFGSRNLQANSHKPSMKANFVWTLAGNIIYAASQWGILILITKLGTVEIVGKFALALAVTAPVIIFSNLALRAVQATDASHIYEFGNYLALRILTTLGAALTIAGIVIFMQYAWDTTLVILFIGLAKSVESISDVIYGNLQQHEQMDKISISMIIKSALSIIGVLAGLTLGKSLLWGVIGLAAAWFLVLIFYDLPILRKMILPVVLSDLPGEKNTGVLPKWDLRKIYQLGRVTLPLGIATSLISLNMNIPRYLLERNFGEHYLGIFAALAYPLTAGTIIINSLGQTATPRLAKFFKEKDVRRFTLLLLQLTGIGFIMGLIYIIAVRFFGQQLLSFIYKPEYAKYMNEFLWMSFAAGIEFTFSFLGYGMTAAQYFKIQPVLFMLSVIVSVVCGYFLIPAFGILGAIFVILITTCFRGFSMAGVNFYVIRNRNTMLAGDIQ